MLQQIHEQFLREHGTKPLLIKAPGRINLIGEHTDYNKGFVLPASINKAIYFAFAKNAKAQFHVQALNFTDKLTYNLATSTATFTHSWGNYLQAIIELLQEKGYELGGLDCIFGGDIPIGAGLSSSAALCSGFLYGLSEMYDLQLSRQEIALIAQAAEHRIGLNCGLMDQYAVIFGKQGHVICLDCQSLEFDYFPIQLQNHSLVLINSKIEHQLAVDSEYNDRRQACEEVVDVIKKEHPSVESLRDVSFELLEKYRPQLAPLLVQRAHFVLSENQRVQQTILALKKGALQEVGQLLSLSHEGLSKAYEVSTSEVDLLVALAEQEEAVVGARMMGGGFGGCTLNLIKNSGKAEALERIVAAYKVATGIQAEVYEVEIGDGVKKVEC